MAHEIRLTKSPIYLLSPEVGTVDCAPIGDEVLATCNIKIYTGDKDDHINQPVLYILHRYIEVISTRRAISFEVSNYIDDYINVNILDILQNAVWAYVEINIDGCTTSSPLISYNFLAVQGYGSYLEGINPVIDSDLNGIYWNSDYIVIRNPQDAIHIPINTDLIKQVQYADIINQPLDTVSYTPSNLSEFVIRYNTPNNINNITDAYFINFFDYSLNPVKTLKIVHACTGDIAPSNLRISYINKQGVIEYFYVFSKEIIDLAVEKETFRTNKITEKYGLPAYPTESHSTQTFNVNGRTSFAVNTGFVKADFDDRLTQLFLSNKVWLTKNNIVYPIVLIDKSIKYKSRLIDKKLDYTLKFEYDFDTIQQIK